MPSCPKHPGVQLEAKKKGWYCEECEANVLSYEAVPREAPASAAPAAGGATGDLDAMPFPVAHPLAFARDGTLTATERLNNALFAAHQAMRVAGLLMLADYLSVEASDRGLEGAIRGLRMPHWGEWTELCGKLVGFWSGRAEGKPERPSRFQSLVDGWRVVATEKAGGDWTARLEGLAGMQGPARNANDAIWKLRNDRAHRMATHTPDRRAEEEKLAKVLPLVEAACGTLFVPGAFKLVRRVEGLSVISAHGPHLDFDFRPETLSEAWAGLLQGHEVVALCGDQAVPAYPLFAPEEGKEPLTLVDGVKRKSLVLLGVQTHGESEAHFGPLTAALARKKVELGLGREETKRSTVAEWSRTLAREDVTALTDRKYFPASYVERGGVDTYAAQALEKGGKAVLLLGEAGSGKSSMLTRLVERLVSTDEAAEADPRPKKRTLDEHLSLRGGGDVVLYLTGRQAYAGDAGWSGTQVLAEAVLRRAGVKSGTFASLADFLARVEESSVQDSNKERRVWVVLDALNEADRFADLLHAVDDVLPAVAKYPWLRLVMSCRTGAYASLERRHKDEAHHGEGVFSNEVHLARFVDEVQKKDVPYLDVRPFEEKHEGPKAYRLRAEAYPGRSCAVAWETLQAELRTLLCNPLHLHVFHETYAGRQDVGAALDEGALLEAYLERLCRELPALKETLERVGRHLVQHHTPAIPAEVVDGWLEAWRKRQGYSSAARVVKLDPIEELVSASILMRPANEGFGADRQLVAFTFSHQKLCEAVVLRELRRQVLPRTRFEEEDLRRFMEKAEAHPDFREYVGALRRVVTAAVDAGRGDFVASLLDAPQDGTRAVLVEAAVKRVGVLWPKDEAKGALEALAKRAQAGDAQRRRWLSDSDFPAWLQQHGRTEAALGLAEARLRTTKAGDGATAVDEQARASALDEVADRLGVLGRRREAQPLWEESLAIRVRLSEAEPGRADLARDVSISFDKLGYVARAEGRSEEARKYQEDGLAIAKRLSEAEPGRADLARDVSISFDRLGDLARDEGRSEEARKYYEDGLALRKRLSGAEPGRADLARDVSISFERLGDLARDEGRSEEARKYYEDGLALRKRLSGAEPGRADLADGVSVFFDRLGDLARAKGRSEEARKYYEDALALRNRLSGAEPGRADLARGVSISFERLGDLAQAEGRSEEARKYYEDGLALRKRLSGAEPGRADLADGVSLFFDRLGDLAWAKGRSEEARKYYEDGLALRKRLSGAEPGRADLARGVSISFERLGDLAQAEGRSEEARKYYEDALAIAKRLSGAEPGRADLAWDVCLSLTRLGDLSAKEKCHREARKYLAQLSGVAARWTERLPAEAQWANSAGWAGVLIARVERESGHAQDALCAVDAAIPHSRRAVAVDCSPNNVDTLAELLALKGALVPPDASRPFDDEALTLRRSIKEQYPDQLAALLRDVATRREGAEADALLAEADALTDPSSGP